MKILAVSLGLVFGMFTAQSAFADPPGLSGKGGADFPSGLEKNEKTPAGWSHGKKEGWGYMHHHRHHHREKMHHHMMDRVPDTD